MSTIPPFSKTTLTSVLRADESWLNMLMRWSSGLETGDFDLMPWKWATGG